MKPVSYQQSTLSSQKKLPAGYRLLVVFLLLVTGYCLPAADVYALDIKRVTFPNNLKTLQVERHNLPVVMMTLLIKASPLNEPSDKAGVAYLTSKMLAEGTAKRKAPDISEEIEFLGASIDISTNSDYTTISLSVLKKDIEKGLDMFSDILLNPSFPENEIARKKELLKGSLKQMEQEPTFVAGKTFIREVFGTHPYGRLVEGTIESIDTIKRDDLLGFYREHYVPDNAVISIVGDLTPGEMKSLINKYLGKWGRPKDSAAQKREGKDLSQSPGTAGPEKAKTVLIDKELTQATIMFGHPGISREDPDYYAVSVMNYVLGGGGFASRLMTSVRDEMGLAYSIFSSFTGNKEPGQFEVQVQTKNESAATVISEILKQVNRMRTGPITDSELKDAKAYLTGSFPRRFETSRRIADFLTAAEFYNLGDNYIEKYPDYINKVTKEDILRVANKYLHTDKYVLVVVGNQKKAGLTDFKPPEYVK